MPLPSSSRRIGPGMYIERVLSAPDRITPRSAPTPRIRLNPARIVITVVGDSSARGTCGSSVAMARVRSCGLVVSSTGSSRDSSEPSSSCERCCGLSCGSIVKPLVKGSWIRGRVAAPRQPVRGPWSRCTSATSSGPRARKRRNHSRSVNMSLCRSMPSQSRSRSRTEAA